MKLGITIAVVAFVGMLTLSLTMFWLVDTIQCKPRGLTYHAHQGCR